MKILIILLFIFIVFWYYRKKKRGLRNEKQRALKVEMRACESCGVFFSESEGYKIIRGDKEMNFCSEKCFEEFLSKERE